MREFFTRKVRFGHYLKTEAGMSRQGLLLILLLLAVIAGGGYIFFFTDMSRPGGGTETQMSHDSLVKKPMPPRPKTEVAGNTVKPPAEQQVTVTTPEHKTDAGKPAPAKPAPEKKTSPPSQSGTKKGPAKPESAKTAVEHPGPTTMKKPATAPKKEAANAPKKREETANSSKETGQDETAVTSAKGQYTLLIGVYVMEKSMTSAKAKLKAAGLVPVVTKGLKKQEPMNRIFMGEFDTYSDASAVKKQIGNITHDTFILPENGKYMLYAGSYVARKSADKECERLSEAGLKPEVRKMNVPMNTYRLTTGKYQSSKQAETETERLKKLGISASVVKSGK